MCCIVPCNVMVLVNRYVTRMHSSRMRTVRSSSRLLEGEGVCKGGECLQREVSAQGGVS